MTGEHLYERIYRELKADICSEIYPPGTRLPSESALSRKYGVQRDTVRRALEPLVREGLILKRPGRGSFVCSQSDAVIFEVDPAHLRNPILAELLQKLAKPPAD